MDTYLSMFICCCFFSQKYAHDNIWFPMVRKHLCVHAWELVWNIQYCIFIWYLHHVKVFFCSNRLIFTVSQLFNFACIFMYMCVGLTCYMNWLCTCFAIYRLRIILLTVCISIHISYFVIASKVCIRGCCGNLVVWSGYKKLCI